ncbi:hypothetical protein K435DRAFT_917387 [Dendrothele bispora CBS 962.96]|uniref:Uncharacterized protein n=1 Tax=Dendrothele bispora (strain CBS 962.96) TaxID=1314807 RepID=A0A4S8MJF5_DENBC|nr:hypothetical protein K435DRAFT_917387 [Dendrothele bispora CBS 962.96]
MSLKFTGRGRWIVDVSILWWALEMEDIDITWLGLLLSTPVPQDLVPLIMIFSELVVSSSDRAIFAPTAHLRLNSNDNQRIDLFLGGAMIHRSRLPLPHPPCGGICSAHSNHLLRRCTLQLQPHRQSQRGIIAKIVAVHNLLIFAIVLPVEILASEQELIDIGNDEKVLKLKA